MFLLLGAAAGRVVYVRRLWRSPAAWLALALLAGILYGSNCSYTQIRRVDHAVQVRLQDAQAWLWRMHRAHPDSLPGHWIAHHVRPITYLDVQKDGHVVLFFLLSLVTTMLFHRYWVQQSPRRSAAAVARWHLLALAGLCLLAGMVELLQWATPEREPKVTDWLLNVRGLVAGATVFWLVALGRVAWRRLRSGRRSGGAGSVGGVGGVGVGGNLGGKGTAPTDFA